MRSPFPAKHRLSRIYQGDVNMMWH